MGNVRRRRSVVSVHVDVGEGVLLGKLNEAAVGVVAAVCAHCVLEALERPNRIKMRIIGCTYESEG